MGRSETESLRLPREDFWSGKTVHFESKVGAGAEEGIIVVVVIAAEDLIGIWIKEIFVPTHSCLVVCQ